MKGRRTALGSVDRMVSRDGGSRVNLEFQIARRIQPKLKEQFIWTFEESIESKVADVLSDRVFVRNSARTSADASSVTSYKYETGGSGV